MYKIKGKEAVNLLTAAKQQKGVFKQGICSKLAWAIDDIRETPEEFGTSDIGHGKMFNVHGFTFAHISRVCKAKGWPPPRKDENGFWWPTADQDTREKVIDYLIELNSLL